MMRKKTPKELKEAREHLINAGVEGLSALGSTLQGAKRFIEESARSRVVASFYIQGIQKAIDWIDYLSKGLESRKKGRAKRSRSKQKRKSQIRKVEIE